MESTSDTYESIQYAGADILLQAIEANVIGEDNDAEQEGSFTRGYSDSGLLDQARISLEKFLRDSKTKSLEKIKNHVLSIADEYGSAYREMENRPNEFALEMSFSLSVKGEVCIVSAERSSMMKVSMKWTKTQ